MVTADFMHHQTLAELRIELEALNRQGAAVLWTLNGEQAAAEAADRSDGADESTRPVEGDR